VIIRILLSILLWISASLGGIAEVHRFKPSQGHQTYAVREPVLRINPGDKLETNTLYSDFFTEKDGPWPGEVGPIYVNGSTPEDTLVIKILKIRPNIATGRSGTSTTYGVLTATEMTPMLHDPVPDKIHIWRIDGKRMTTCYQIGYNCTQYKDIIDESNHLRSSIWQNQEVNPGAALPAA